MRRKNNTTISIDLKIKERLLEAVMNREDLNKRLSKSSWDDLMNYLAYIIEQKKDLY